MPGTTSRRAQAARTPLDHDPRRLRRRRIEAGLTLAALAAKTNLSSGHLCELEKGTRNPSPHALARLAAALGCEPADLMPGRAA